MARTIMAAAGVPVAEGKVVHRSELANGHPITPPYVLKPVTEGSSVGVIIVSREEDDIPAQVLAKDWPHGDLLLAEAFVAGRELTCAVMDGKALGVIDIVPDADFYDYHAKYAKGGSKHILPAVLSPNIYQTIQDLSVVAHHALGCRGVSRADFRFDDRPGGTGELICLEVNTQPGMTETSLVPEMAAHAGYSFEELVTWIVKDASCNR
jgi:D-alanine-D-alanine ligase